MNQSLFLALAAAAASIGALHSLAPDHWLPFAAVARARGWSAGRTARVTLLCSLLHGTVSAILGFLGARLGVAMVEGVGRRVEAVGGVLLIVFGVGYALWGLRRAWALRVHGHLHHHYDHVHDPSRATAWSLAVFFALDPCVAVVPLVFAAVPLGIARTLAVVALYEAAMAVTMLGLVLPARAGAARLRWPWLDVYGDAAAGGFIVAVGLLVSAIGW